MWIWPEVSWLPEKGPTWYKRLRERAVVSFFLHATSCILDGVISRIHLSLILLFSLVRGTILVSPRLALIGTHRVADSSFGALRAADALVLVPRSVYALRS